MDWARVDDRIPMRSGGSERHLLPESMPAISALGMEPRGAKGSCGESDGGTGIAGIEWGDTGWDPDDAETPSSAWESRSNSVDSALAGEAEVRVEVDGSYLNLMRSLRVA